MAEKINEEKLEFNKSVKIALKTLSCCFIITMFIFASIFVISPKTSLKINEMFGFTKVQGLNYQMIYSRSNKITDLYNVIIFEEEQKNFEKELFYIDKIVKREDYNSFCDTLDKASIKKSSDKNMIPYSSNVNGYLLSRKVICLYNLEKDGIETFVFNQTKNGKITEYSFATFVDLVYSNKTLSKAEKQAKFRYLLELSVVQGESLVNMNDLIDGRIDALKNALLAETDSNQKIILNYSLLRVYGARFYIYQVLGDETKKNENSNLYSETKTALNALINS